jgi:hypothetical protein
MVMTTTLDKIMRICSNTANAARYRHYLEGLPQHEQEQRLKDLIASEAAHQWPALDARPETESQGHRELTTK